MSLPSRVRLLVLVKAQPALSTKHGEVVCVAGVRLDKSEPEWIRLFPVVFRDLEQMVRFRKYQILEVDVRRARSDGRRESFTPDMTTARLGTVMSSGRAWEQRWEPLRPLAGTVTMCELNRRQRSGEHEVPSLAMVKPVEVLDAVVSDTPDFTTAQTHLAEVAAEASLIGEAREPLTPPPFHVTYVWRCADGACPGHRQTCVDWEVGGAGRKWLRSSSREVVRAQLRAKFLDEMCGPTKDTWFFVGNQHQHPQSSLVLGVFWPPARPPSRDDLALF